MLKNRKSGFTLIELLVVIAIIGILSSVVLASLNTARAKGSDAAIKSDLTGIQTQAALYYDNNGNTYSPSVITNNCGATGVFGDPTVVQQINGIKAQGVTPTCYATTTTSFAISATLKTSGSFCVDSNGNATTTAVNATTGLCI